MKATAAAHPNLAFVKYWGKVDPRLNLPTNPSISVNLDGATTVTTVAFSDERETDQVFINDQPASPPARQRVVRHLDRVRRLAGVEARALVASRNDFPADAGIASSASAFAALSLAASRAAGLELDERTLSILARKGSGSASRSIPGGFVEWQAGERDEDSYAYPIAPPEHWDIRVVTAIVDQQPKAVSSGQGHRAAPQSPFFNARLAALPQTLTTVRRALLDRDLSAFGLALEREAVSMHVVCMTSPHPERDWLSGIYYWGPGSMRLVHAVQAWRREGLEVYFTMDAGANVHLICRGGDQAELEGALCPLLLELEGWCLVSRPGRGAWLVGEGEAGAQS